MYTAQQKRKENIAEYLLYMFQVEDTLRAFSFDINKLENHIIKPLNLAEKDHHQFKDWYKNLALMMDREKIREKGHLQFIQNLTGDLYDFHLRIMLYEVDEAYLKIYRTTAGLINEMKRKSDREANDVEVCLSALYGYLLMKIRGTSISDETREAMMRFSAWLGRLSFLYHRFETGDLEL
jgi:hypothetical protein